MTILRSYIQWFFVAWRLGLYVLHCIRIFMLQFPLKLFHNYQCILITAFKISYSAATTKAPKHIINTSLLALKGYYNLFLWIQTLEKQVRSDNRSILQVLSYISTESTNVTAAWDLLKQLKIYFSYQWHSSDSKVQFSTESVSRCLLRAWRCCIAQRCCIAHMGPVLVNTLLFLVTTLIQIWLGYIYLKCCLFTDTRAC